MKWVEAFGFPNYEVSEDGQIRNSKGLVMKQRIDGRDYPSIRIYKDGWKHSRRIGKLIWESFNGCRCKETVDHIDRNKKNNNLNNLRCITAAENSKNRDNYDKGNKYNLTPELKKEILRKKKYQNYSCGQLSREYGIPQNYLSQVFQRQTWEKYLDDKERI